MRKVRISEEERVRRVADAELLLRGLRKCNACGEIKDIKSFHKYSDINLKCNTVSWFCKPCFNTKKKQNRLENPIRFRAAQYGIEECQLLGIWYATEGKCQLCGCDLSLTIDNSDRGHRVMCVDHNHSTGAVRGILCSLCNRRIGLYELSISMNDRIQTYIQKKYDIKKTSEEYPLNFDKTKNHRYDNGIVSRARKRGVSPDVMNYFWKRCGGKCEVCGDGIFLNMVNGEDKMACCDHDHVTQRIRGMVCNRCNYILSGYDWAKKEGDVVDIYLGVNDKQNYNSKISIIHKHSPGKFVVFDGIDGAGSTSQSREIFQYIRDRMGNNSILWTREPTDSETGQLIKRIIRKSVKTDRGDIFIPSAKYMARLFLKDRLEHLENVIIPNLHKGKNVICDRYIYSMIGYQALTSEMPIKEAYEWVIPLCSGCLEPDIVIILDVDSNDVVHRIHSRIDPVLMYDMESNIYRKEGLQYRLSKFYKKLPEIDGSGGLTAPGKIFFHIDSSRSFERVFDDCLQVVKRAWLV